MHFADQATRSTEISKKKTKSLHPNSLFPLARKRRRGESRRPKGARTLSSLLFFDKLGVKNVYRLPLYPGTAGPRCHFATYYLPSLSYLRTMFFLSFGKIG
jgi:hypothetical protein